MLVLGRYDGQAIRIAENIEVRVVRARGHRVTLGITAPRKVPIVRTELLDEKGADDVTDQSDSGARRPGR